MGSSPLAFLSSEPIAMLLVSTFLSLCVASVVLALLSLCLGYSAAYRIASLA